MAWLGRRNAGAVLCTLAAVLSTVLAGEVFGLQASLWFCFSCLSSATTAIGFALLFAFLACLVTWRAALRMRARIAFAVLALSLVVGGLVFLHTVG